MSLKSKFSLYINIKQHDKTEAKYYDHISSLEWLSWTIKRKKYSSIKN